MPGVTFRRVLDVARWVREEVARDDIPSVPKTSGASGLHIYIPLPRGTPYAAARIFCQLLATLVAERHPDVATIERRVNARPARLRGLSSEQPRQDAGRGLRRAGQPRGRRVDAAAANASGPSMNAMLKGQMLTTALDVYFSAPALGGNKIGAAGPIGGVSIDLTLIGTNIATCSTFVNVSSAFGGPRASPSARC